MILFCFHGAGTVELGEPDLSVEYPVLELGEEKKIGDNGLKKKLLREGEGLEAFNAGDGVEVAIHFLGTLLDGDKYASSNDGDTSIKFILRQGLVIKGWIEAIKSMKKGEKALFTIPPELGNGDDDSYSPIPPNSTIQFEIELASWISTRDLCKDGGIFKKLLTKGMDGQNPRDLDEVLIKYEVHLEDGTIGSKSDGLEFSLKNGYFCLALPIAVRTMRKGEKVLLTVKPQYGFGETGREASVDEGGVPPNATLEINLELVSSKTVSDIKKRWENYEKDSKGRRSRGF